jgi:hypothetical protein
MAWHERWQMWKLTLLENEIEKKRQMEKHLNI